MSKASSSMSGHRVPMAIVILIIAASWVFTPTIIKWFEPNFCDRGITGDMFGITNSLFSGLALLGVFYTVLLQRAEIALAKSDTEAAKNAYNEQKAMSEKSHHYERYIDHTKNEPILFLHNPTTFSKLNQLNQLKGDPDKSVLNVLYDPEYETEYHQSFDKSILYLRNFGETAFDFVMEVYQEKSQNIVRRFEAPILYYHFVFELSLSSKRQEYLVMTSYTNRIGYKVIRKFIMDIKNCVLCEIENSFLDTFKVEGLSYYQEKEIYKKKIELLNNLMKKDQL